MKLQIDHRTSYHYARPVFWGPHRLMFRPRESHHVALEKFTLAMSPGHHLRWIRDLHENNIGLLDLMEPGAELSIESKCIVNVDEDNPFHFIIAPEATEFPFEYHHDIRAELLPLSYPLYLLDLERVREWVRPLWHPGKRVDTLELLQEMNTVIYRDIKYQRRERRGVQSPAETLEKETGSCRDFAALFMEACRFLGLAARFVSGYMYSDKITGRMSMHAWAEVYLPGAGWIGFDPSWGILADCNFIPVAVTRHPEHAPPISGTYFGTGRDFIRSEVELYVRKLEDPAAS